MNADMRRRYSFSSWKNNSSETCPPFGVARVTSITALANGLTQVQATKPDTTFSRIYIVNGPYAVLAGKSGQYFNSSEVIVACEASAAFGEGWGPKPGQWTLAKNYPMTASIIGEHAGSGSYFYRARWGDINAVIGKLNGSLSAGGSQAMSVWYGDWAGDTTWDISGVSGGIKKAGSASNSSGKKNFADFRNGLWFFQNIECE